MVGMRSILRKSATRLWWVRIRRVTSVGGCTMQVKATFKDVARAAGVSDATVSRVANATTRVDPAIQQRVREAALKLGVDLSRAKKAKAIAFVLSNRDMLHPFHARILVGAEAYCAARGWDIVFLSYRYEAQIPWKDLHLPRVLQRRDLIHGVLLAGNNSPNLLDLLRHKGITFVVLGNNVAGSWSPQEYDVVWSDDVHGAYEITRYLHSMGHRDIGFVGNCHLPWFARCYAGYCQALQEVGLSPRHYGFDTQDQIEIGYLGMKSILSRGERLTAVFAGTDACAQGVYKALREGGLRIPRDCSVVGFNDTYGPILDPPLTTVREFPDHLGKSMLELLVNRIAHPTQLPQQITIPTEIVRRESCRAIPAAAEASSGEGARGISFLPPSSSPV
jgi:DNA-binding LacI/PurR family transcriptional regulator